MVISKTGFLHINSDLTKDDILALDRIRAGWCLSLFLPLQHDGREANQASIQLRDLGVGARRELALRGLPPREIETLLAPIERLADTDFPRLDGRGLALLSSHAGSACFLLPDAPAPQVEVDLRFRLEPLVPMLIEEDGFFLLTLGLHAVRLWEGGRKGLREVALNGAHIHQPQTPILDHHEAEGYCREVDAAVRKRMRDRHLPLILAGAHPLLAKFRKVCAYPHLLEQAVVGNPESEAIGSHLHARAWACLKEARAQELASVLAQYREALASSQTAAGITDVVPCALQGRVGHLLVRKGYVEWGVFDATNGQVTPLPSPDLRSQDLVNLACLHTLLDGGRVHILEADRMPGGAAIAALCRF